MQEYSLYITLGVFILLVGALLSAKIRSVYAFSVASGILLVSQVISLPQFIAAFSNTSILSIFILIFLARVIRENFNVVGWLDKMYQNTSNPRWFLFKNSLGVSVLSAFMNNTPIVALMIPYAYNWSENNSISASKILLPVSYAAITGGMITVIGTSTNLVLNGFLESAGLPLLTVYDYLIPGLLVSVLAAVYAATIGYGLLPNNKLITGKKLLNEKSYLLEIALSSNAKIHGKSIHDAGLRNVDGAYLAEIIRSDKIISPVNPETVLQSSDRLIFAGDHQILDDLVNNEPDLQWGKTEKYAIGDAHNLLEAVIPYNSELIGGTLKEIGFRAKFHAAVVGIHRNGGQLKGRLGDIILEAGDLLIIASGKGADSFFKGQKNLYVINRIQRPLVSAASNSQRVIFLLSILVGAGFSIFGNYPFIVVLLIVLGGAIIGKLTNTSKLKKDINLELFAILGSAIVIGNAMMQSGVGDLVGKAMQNFSPALSDWAIITLLMGLTVVLTSFVTNVAAISIVFPIAFALLPQLELESSILFLAIAFAASAAFITPVSYQTNLMVQAPGGYSNKDFLKYGMPMLVLYLLVIFGWLYINC